VKRTYPAAGRVPDIDGTLLVRISRSQPRISVAASRHTRSGIGSYLVTGRRHAFALPIAERLGFYDKLVVNAARTAAITRSYTGETFHRDLLPACDSEAGSPKECSIRGNLGNHIRSGAKGALFLEAHRAS